jgi:hypothetical protein
MNYENMAFTCITTPVTVIAVLEIVIMMVRRLGN